MSLKRSSLPQTDAEWADLAEKTLSAFEQPQDTTTSPSADAPLPGTSDFARTVDHTLLKLDASDDGIIQCCKEAKQYGFKVSHVIATATRPSGSLHAIRFVVKVVLSVEPTHLVKNPGVSTQRATLLPSPSTTVRLVVCTQMSD